jgi:phage baseplate assembly protein W
MANISLADKYTITEKKTELYSDFGVNLQQHPARKDLLRYTNETAIKRSITNLLMTNFHERMFQPYLGANLSQLLFEPFSEDLLGQLRHHILSCISKFEPRVRVIELTLTATPDECGVYVALRFSVISTATPTTLNLILNRVR